MWKILQDWTTEAKLSSASSWIMWQRLFEERGFTTPRCYPHWEDFIYRQTAQWNIIEKFLQRHFSWPCHACQTFDDLKNAIVRLCHITSRLAWTLPSINFATGGEAGIVGMETLLRKFGCASGVMIQVKRVPACCNWKHAYLKLRFCGQGWFVIENILSFSNKFFSDRWLP